MRARVLPLIVAAVLCPGRGVGTAGDQADPVRTARLARLLDYDPGLDAASKTRALHGTTAILADLGIRVLHDREAVEVVTTASRGAIGASPLLDRDALYDAVHYLTDLTRLPGSLHLLFERILVVRSLKALGPRDERMRPVPLAYESTTRTILVDHENLNQLEFFGNFVHPKVNFAMLLEVAFEARLARMAPAVRRELGIEAVIDDREWARLNGGRADGWAVYNGEDVTFVGFKTAARVTPPGMLYDALREWRSGVPEASYAGLPEPTQPWWSPRHGPASDRQNLLRCLFARSPDFYNRVGGRNGLRQDRVLQEKTRLILYAAFVASGGVLDHAYWERRHPGNQVVVELTRDFDADFLSRLNERLDHNPDTRGFRLEPLR